MAEQFISLARQLPTRLQTFFAKYPPGTCNTARTNPFKPTVHTVTGKWHNPVFSYRRQAELCKMARKWGVEELLPHSKKRSDIREEQRLKRVAKGIHVKGTKEERTLKARLQMRMKAMENMPKLIEEWKRRGHGKGWKEWPSGKARF
ncbi:hypothetical protein FPQ18DRAFT_357513 [Pyronema domesticum]|uniref:Similar to 54S ribosomal protein L25, mitochondrial acc. no. P23369 n=1 Tax=Pyronema omphalodes (strain CBS 100304) TaxID=1076935 RepID=U4KZG3_PYROM|nr:hypothetical protein FPQ18DRAFT_357513 [Pyronema domesticum]CCX05079.1 Similar to 54S ribosomal protein L25, mitochondrial; acc. no. P23369 [Pyronema omphalodes CBS 100304]